MPIRVFYNDTDPFCCAWLSNLMDKGHVRPGKISDKSIADLTPEEVRPYELAHFFAGIAGWDHALTLAGWRFDGRVTWTGSCPCQPFSAAGKGDEFADERHLWPAWFRLIRECRPPVLFGEQVASRVALAWFDHVAADLESAHYAVAAADLCAASAGAFHIRQRLWFVADADAGRWAGERGRGDGKERAAGPGAADSLADALEYRLGSGSGDERGQEGAGGEHRHDAERCGGLGDAERARFQGGIFEDVSRARGEAVRGQPQQSGGGAGAWDDVEWIACRDGKNRPTQPGIFPLLDGISGTLASVFSIPERSWMEVVEYGARSQTNPDEILRMVRARVLAAQSGQGSATGMRVEFPSPALLLTFLQCVDAARHGTAVERGSAKARSEIIERAVRSVRDDGGSVHSPCRWEPEEQFAGQPATTVQQLSFLLACRAASFGAAAVAAHAQAIRVGALRAAGNAIVPQVAAQFVRAVME